MAKQFAENKARWVHDQELKDYLKQNNNNRIIYLPNLLVYNQMSNSSPVREVNCPNIEFPLTDNTQKVTYNNLI